ncbi:uncharacterized protein EI90DRAFT_3291183 [Cantharellus anzutake]|uniref:uncharacterized protein n=1 Tax=Cantharellus anzutake TaxID=1750568 RepID=UPI0019060D28|nr:uncharacterized protein EI90DRAFT_3291183 [Cantharellus anzutake]KAF8326805.1 hypothetical protein EI90DRAFT_3291183 [Cantharellus anzutake]
MIARANGYIRTRRSARCPNEQAESILGKDCYSTGKDNLKTQRSSNARYCLGLRIVGRLSQESGHHAENRVPATQQAAMEDATLEHSYCVDVMRARLYNEKHLQAPFEDARLYEAKDTPNDARAFEVMYALCLVARCSPLGTQCRRAPAVGLDFAAAPTPFADHGMIYNRGSSRNTQLRYFASGSVCTGTGIQNAWREKKTGVGEWGADYPSMSRSNYRLSSFGVDQ